jgi:hypothetical protein
MILFVGKPSPRKTADGCGINFWIRCADLHSVTPLKTVRPSSLPSVKCKSKPAPLQAWAGPMGSRKLTLPEFLDDLHM